MHLQTLVYSTVYDFTIVDPSLMYIFNLDVLLKPQWKNCCKTELSNKKKLKKNKKKIIEILRYILDKMIMIFTLFPDFLPSSIPSNSTVDKST